MRKSPYGHAGKAVWERDTGFSAARKSVAEAHGRMRICRERAGMWVLCRQLWYKMRGVMQSEREKKLMLPSLQTLPNSVLIKNDVKIFYYQPCVNTSLTRTCHRDTDHTFIILCQPIIPIMWHLRHTVTLFCRRCGVRHRTEAEAGMPDDGT